MKKIFLVLLLSVVTGFCVAPTSIADPTFTQNVQPIFTDSCALSGCHISATAVNAQLDLSEGNAYAAIVNTASIQQPSALRVVPGDAANSYLYKKITGAPGITGVQMPKIGFLSQDKIDTIASWINNGALNN